MATDPTEVVAKLYYRASNSHTSFYTNLADHAELDRSAARIITAQQQEIERLRGETFLASAEAAEYHRDNAISMWIDEVRKREAAESRVQSLEEALRVARGLVDDVIGGPEPDEALEHLTDLLDAALSGEKP